MTNKHFLAFILLCFSSLFYHSLFGLGLASVVGAIIKTLISCFTLSLVMTSIKTYQWRMLATFAFTLNFAALYFLALYYGRFTSGMLASLAETNAQEALEYVSNIDLASLLETLVVTGVFAWSCHNLRYTKQKYIHIIIIAIGALFIGGTHAASKGIQGTRVSEEQYRLPGEELILKILAANANTLILATGYEYWTLKSFENSHTENQWKDVSIKAPLKDIYVVVLGESAIKNKFTLYSYRRATTDKLEDTHDISIVADPIAPSVLTRISVPRLFNINHKSQINYGLNIIELANMAGFDTYWISNQGVVGNHDTPVSAIANKAKQHNYLNSDYELAQNDRLLQTELLNIIKQKHSQNPLLVILHTIGSHQDFCQRLDSKSKRLPKSEQKEQQECYDNSILATYDLLTSLKDILTQSKYRYRMLYVADHALVATDKPPYYLHGTGSLISKTALEVPMIFFEDTPVELKRINQSYYLSNFPHTLADWLGIQAAQINVKLSIINPSFDPKLQQDYIIDDRFQPRRFSDLPD